jgi:hypothetical protein
VALRLYESGGSAAHKPDARGKKTGSGRSLSADQELSIQRTICDQRPEQLKMDFALWSRAAVMQLIEREHGIKPSVRAVGIHHLQCLDGCMSDIWDAEDFHPEIDDESSELTYDFPRCPYCAGIARPNILMFDDGGWLGYRSDLQEANFSAWRRKAQRPVVIEIGAGRRAERAAPAYPSDPPLPGRQGRPARRRAVGAAGQGEVLGVSPAQSFNSAGFVFASRFFSSGKLPGHQLDGLGRRAVSSEWDGAGIIVSDFNITVKTTSIEIVTTVFPEPQTCTLFPACLGLIVS